MTDAENTSSSPQPEGAAPAARERSDEGPQRRGFDRRGGPGGDRDRGGDRGGAPRRDGGGPRGGGYASGPGGARRRRFPRRKVCWFCVNKAEWIDYKDSDLLRRFVSDRGKILPRRVTGACAKHQRMITAAVKRSRQVALLPFRAG